MTRSCPALRVVVVLALLIGGASGCTRVSGTGRQQFNVLSVDDEIRLGDEAFDEARQPGGAAANIITSGPQYERVQRVAGRVFDSANRRHPEIARRFDWRIVLVNDAEVINAWALPGGDCAVYTGMLEVASTDDMLAAVLGHEAAHAIARHGGERISQGLILQLGQAGMVLADMPPAAQDATMMALGVGTLKFSRDQESEADALGLLIAADAGYDPRAAVELWKKMAARGGSAPIEFLSTHPSEQTRIKRLEQLMPRAMQIYEARMRAARSSSAATQSATVRSLVTSRSSGDVGGS